MKEYSYGIIPYLIDDNGVSILLSRTSLKSSTYDFVKGKIEKGETKKECAVREVFEEIGIRINPDDLENMYSQPNKKKDIGLYLINWNKYINKPFILEEEEIAEVSWFNVLKLPEVSKNQRLILTHILIKFNKLNFTQRVIN